MTSMFSTMKRWCTVGTLLICAGSALGCGDGGSADPAEALVSRFPSEVAHVREGRVTFGPQADGFSASAQDEEELEPLTDDAPFAPSMDAIVPLRADEPVRFEPSGAVREGQRELSVDVNGEEGLINPFWSPAPPLNTSRTLHTATLLLDGQVLVAGGAHHTSTGWKATASCELYDPKVVPAGSWTTSATLSLTYPRWSHTATLIDRGRVLVTGGWSGEASRRTVEIYDPTMKDWLAAPSMASPRHGHTATRLQDGRVLVVGGLDDTTPLKLVEIYDPTSNTWTAGPPLAVARAYHTATLLLDGRVLVAGGKGSSATSSTEMYDPSINGWSHSTTMISARYVHTATLLPSGKVLVAGGFNGSVSLKTVELFDPTSLVWAPEYPMLGARGRHTATWLDGACSLLVAGGINGSTYLNTAELYSPGVGWSATYNTMTAHRASHTATQLTDGRVLVAGGHVSGTAATATTELFNP